MLFEPGMTAIEGLGPSKITEVDIDKMIISML